MCVYELDERHSSEYIAFKLVEASDEWNISNENIVAVTTDEAAYMIKAIKYLTKNVRLYILLMH